MNSEHGNGSSKHRRITEEAVVHLDESFFEHSGGIRTNSETTRSEVAPSCTTGNSKSSNSVPSSSSENCSDDFFQMDTIIIPISKTTDHEAPPKPKGNTKPLLIDGKNDVYSGPLFQLEEIFGSSRSTSQASDATPESFIPILSPTQSPPIQVMERPRGFDPDRIPASVFAMPSSHMGWSVASNESLFSIPIGNASFSRDHALKLAGETNKPNEVGNSGELYISKEYKSGELDNSSGFYMSGELQNSCELVRFRQPSPMTKGEHKAQNFDLRKTGVCEKTKVNLPNRTIKIVGEVNVEANHHLDETRTNIQSLAFPVNKKSSKSPCICKNCSCKFCSCKWPCYSSCYCKRPSFSSCCCKCPSCSSCCCNCPSCCFKRPSCSCKWSSCCCNWPSCSNCSCKWPSCCCKRPCCSCKGLSWPSCSCKWLCSPSCCCKWPSCSGCCCKSTYCCKFSCWPSCRCKCPTWPSCHCRCLSWSRCSCKCSSWLSCCSKSHCSTCRL